MNKSIWNKLASITAVLLTVGVMTVFKACDMKDDGTFMHCHYVQMYVFYIGIAEIVLCAAAMLINNSRIRILVCVIGAVLALISVLLPGRLMGMCMMETMRCHVLMKPCVTILGALLAIFQILMIVGAFRDKK